VRELIKSCLAQTRAPDDLIAAATERVEPDVLAAWFRMPLRPAAVLIPLTERADGLRMLLTERTHTVRDHPGQVAFPGGSEEPEDPDLLTTALRESWEEIGLRPEQVEVAGYLPAQAVISGYAVLPVVGFYTQPFEPRIDPREVASVFEVPFEFLQDSNNLLRVDRERNGIVLKTYEYQFAGHRIWGATALIIRLLLEQLRTSQEKDS
jgi:8-oxo-dGTP pyrophosphatase MutT (NUDIX family)